MFGKYFREQHERLVQRVESLADGQGVLIGANLRLKEENAQLRATVEWMKIRLNSVEKERAVLISAAIGIKVPVPEFMPVTGDADMQKTFNEMPNLSTVGEDAEEEAPPVDYSQLPGYRAQK